MKISTSTTINAPKEKVWGIITDFEHAPTTISAIEKVEILEQPESGLLGLKWRETRVMFGKSATEVMWITEAEENGFYQTRAESHGSIYKSRMTVADTDGGTELTMSFEGEPQTTGAKVMSALMGFMFKGATKKAVAKDLADIKAKAEATD